MLPAENSAVVAQEDNYRGLAEPQGTQAKFLAVWIREVNHRQPAVKCWIHISHFDYPQLPVKSAPIPRVNLTSLRAPVSLTSACKHRRGSCSSSWPECSWPGLLFISPADSSIAPISAEKSCCTPLREQTYICCCCR